jgi:O-acetyl-ADP-ribose deacetylase
VKLRIVSPNNKIIEFHGPADITEQTTEALVNAANSSLIGGGGVDGAIHRRGGPAILQECRQYISQNGKLPAGRAMLTRAGNLRAKYVIHTVGPMYRGGDHGEAEQLASCYRECLRLAEEVRIKSLAFPAISTGAYGYPVGHAATVAVTTVLNELARKVEIERVHFVLFDLASLNAYTSVAEKTAGELGYRVADAKPEDFLGGSA